jgi:asparagine synthase (glutamine-hydrolysing)
MCGIFGSVFTAAHVDVAAALASIRHRGPDASGVYRRPGVVLGHNRLSIIDLSEAASQPMLSRDQNVAVVFNGEIYNHHEVRADLEKLGHQFRTRSDTEVIVEGYLAWGADVIERLDGMFAIAIYDDARRRLVLARDRMGKKPLFYALAARSLRFASEPKALFASGVPLEMDPAALPSLLTFGHAVAPKTLYKGVHELPPASILSLDEGGAPSVRRYYRAPVTAPKLAVSAREAAREVRGLVEAAVERRLEADVPLGAFLSGGIDSTIIVGVMAKLGRGRVKTFTVGFEGDARYDETGFARIAADAFGTDHTELTLKPQGLELIEELVRANDGPFGDETYLPASLVAQATRERVTVALTGDGGDELFCGYPRFLTVEAMERVPRVVRSLAASIARRFPASPAARGRWARLARTARRSALPLPDRLLSWHTYFGFELYEMLTEEARRSADLDEPFETNTRILEQSAGASPLSRILDHNLQVYLPYDLLPKADRTSMMHSLELRSPFLDTQLVDYVTRLPDHFKRRGPVTKWILKRAFRDLLPPQILRRRKMGFGVPLDTWFRGEREAYLTRMLGPGAVLYQWIRRPFVERLLAEQKAGVAENGLRLWLLLTLEIWLRSLAPPRLR